jgi:molybdopterin molybdotransferase
VISLEEAQSRLLALAKPLAVEFVDARNAVGRWAAAPVLAQRTQPALALSAMDGYAIAGENLTGPWTVVAESRAGERYTGSISATRTVRIFTGAALPPGADTVIMQEDVAPVNGTISLLSGVEIRGGQHVRAAGSDFSAGQILIEVGQQLTAARIGLAIMGGHAELPVQRRPRITILSTGDELKLPGQMTGPDQIPASNSYMVAAMLQSLPCDVLLPPILPDDLDMITQALEAAAACSDVVVTIGGASVGDHDLVKPALEAAGAKLDFWKIAMRPGKPLIAGRLGGAIVLGLPGNPVSAFVTAILFLKPAVAQLSGAASPLPERSSATLGADLPANGNRTDHIRAILKGNVATPVGVNDSAALLNLSIANALIVREPGAPPAQVGERVEIVEIA